MLERECKQVAIFKKDLLQVERKHANGKEKEK
jgi:hypothetical protein